MSLFIIHSIKKKGKIKMDTMYSVENNSTCQEMINALKSLPNEGKGFKYTAKALEDDLRVEHVLSCYGEDKKHFKWVGYTLSYTPIDFKQVIQQLHQAILEMQDLYKKLKETRSL